MAEGNDGEHWRARAADALLLSQHMAEPTARHGMIAIARNYALLADQAERRPPGPPRWAELMVRNKKERHRNHTASDVPFPPHTLSVLCRAFELACAATAPNVAFGRVEATRIQLAAAMLSVATANSIEAEVLAKKALQVLDRS